MDKHDPYPIWGANHSARALAVADRHMRHASPEFSAWLAHHLTLQEGAQLFAYSYGQLSLDDVLRLRNELNGILAAWRRYVEGNPADLRSEIAREP